MFAWDLWERSSIPGVVEGTCKAWSCCSHFVTIRIQRGALSYRKMALETSSNYS